MEGRLTLALDTATEVTVVALGVLSPDLTVVLDAEEIDAPRSAMSRLLVAATDVVGRNGYSFDEIDEVVAGRGPGSFTGVRIGVATAKGLAHGLSKPLAGVGTLDAVAWRFSAIETLVGVVGDAMRGEVYPALFRCGRGSVERLSEDRVSDPVRAAEAWREYRGRIVLAGNGLAKYAEIFSAVLGKDCVAEPEMWRPSGAGLLMARALAAASGEAPAAGPGALLPVYTRLSDAEENERRRSGEGRLPASGVGGAP
jgi:N6-L-threonylcarbamoyladenine synthase